MSGAKEYLVRRAPVCVLALAALAATHLHAGDSRVVIYDAAEHQTAAVSTGNVFAVSGAWDLSGCGQFEISFEPPPAGTPWTYFSVTMENAVTRKPDANGSGSAGLFTMNVFLEKQESIAKRPIPPPMPALQAAVSRMDRVAAAGLFAQVWPSRYWTYKEAGWGNTIKAWSLDPSNAVVRVSVANLGGKTPPRVRRIVATGPANRAAHEPAFAKIPADGFFPFVDRYGQFRWKDWPGKIGSDEDLAAAKAAEDADLAAHPGPAGRDRWGGWEDGPKFEATGHFHVRKVRGKWWFVDPDGRLWWSHGPVRVSASCGMTPYKGREGHFEFLPDADSPFAAFYQTRDALLWPYYVKRGVTNTYDFTASNLYRKYGDDWRRVWAERVHRRLRSWGANTIANSSDAGVMALSRTPYCDRIELKSRQIEATVSHGTWWPFRDPFDPSFREGLRRQLLEHKAQLDDPWCFGFFVDNELGWGAEGDMARWVWESPAEQPARIEFARRLAAKYGRVPENPPKEDLKEFSLAVIEEYFRSVRDEFKKIAPQKLYMGCRFSGGLDESVKRISAKYCDVMSFNYYDRDVLAFSPLPAGIDKPVIIGEFHFGALDRGPINTGLVWLESQEERRAVYCRYLESALRDPRIVGAHWHQYCDDVPTGRFDGENFQIGWVDVCDTPYPETIAAVRWVGENMYGIRYGEGAADEGATAADAPPPGPVPRHVVFLGFDGLSGSRLAHGVPMPNLSRLMAEGAWTLASRSILPSASACNWRSLFTCSPVENHGFTKWNTREPEFEPAALDADGRYPDIFSELRRQRPGARIEYIYEWSGMAFVAATNACDFVHAVKGDEQISGTTDVAVERIRSSRPDFLAVAYDNPDHAGHGHGWDSAEYVDCCRRLDEAIGRVLAAIRDAGMADETVVVISSDHGGRDRRHGGATLAEMARPVVIFGPGVKRGWRIRGASDVCDTGATLAALLGLRFPQAWTGRPMRDAFK